MTLLCSSVREKSSGRGEEEELLVKNGHFVQNERLGHCIPSDVKTQLYYILQHEGFCSFKGNGKKFVGRWLLKLSRNNATISKYDSESGAIHDLRSSKDVVVPGQGEVVVRTE